MTTVRLLSMADGQAFVEVTFDDSGAATSVRLVNTSTSTAAGVMNGVPMTVPPGTDVTIAIPSPGYPAFTLDDWAASAAWPA